jgi:hypothetical protein
MMNLKNLDNEDKMLIGAGVVSLGVVGWYWYKTKKESEPITPIINTPTVNTPVNNIPTLATPPLVQSTISLNKSLILKIGSRGLEVKALQKKLGIASDGIFGAITQNALFRVKGVKQISLNAFDGKISNPTAVKITTTPTMRPDVPYKKGQKLMVNVRSGFTAQNVRQKADGTYFTEGENITTLMGFGDEIGTIKSVLIRTDGLVRYVVEGKVLGFSRLLWVAHKNVKPIKN